MPSAQTRTFHHDFIGLESLNTTSSAGSGVGLAFAAVRHGEFAPMRDAYIVGVGQVPVVKCTEHSSASLGAQAVSAAYRSLPDIVPTALYVGNMLSGLLERQTQMSVAVAAHAGLSGIESFTVDAACSAGAAAARWGLMAVWSGVHDVVAVCGTERMSAVPRAELASALATASDWPTEGALGKTFVSLAAQLHGEYLRRFGWREDVFGPFAVNAHRNASDNPNARFREVISLEQYAAAPRINEHLRLYDAAPVCDGAACVLLASKPTAERLKRDGFPVVRVAASATATDTLGLTERSDQLWLAGLARATQRAFTIAGLTPSDVDVYEPHDAFGVMTALSLEASGFAEPGRGVTLAHEIGRHGRLPTNTLGGLKGRGHPVGASGVYQLVEAFLQLTGNAGRAQVPGEPAIALTQNLGGTGATATVHILVRE